RHHGVIGPGGACTQAAERYLASGDHRNMGAPIGQAGNGTAMRTAALGLWFGKDHPALISTVADISRLTHQDPRSVAGGVAIACAANLLALDHSIDESDLCKRLADAIDGISHEFSELIRLLPNKLNDPERERFIASAGQASPEFSKPIISPFVIPTVLASIACVLDHRDSWVDAVTSAVRLGGDVDTLGAIVGTLSGAIHGIEGIPDHLVRSVQDSETIASLAAQYHSLIQSRSAAH
ncbi:MAG: ADP-ribosylglycohydrolase family protein, partial [Planctomycetota bacterium]